MSYSFYVTSLTKGWECLWLNCWLNHCVCVWLSQICSQLSERLEKQQTANRGELEKIRVTFTHRHTRVHQQHGSTVAWFGLGFSPESCSYVRRLAEESKSLQQFGSWTFCLDGIRGEGHLGCELPVPGLPKDSQHDKRKVSCVKVLSRLKQCLLFYYRWLCR